MVGILERDQGALRKLLDGDFQLRKGSSSNYSSLGRDLRVSVSDIDNHSRRSILWFKGFLDNFFDILQGIDVYSSRRSEPRNVPDNPRGCEPFISKFHIFGTSVPGTIVFHQRRKNRKPRKIRKLVQG